MLLRLIGEARQPLLRPAPSSPRRRGTPSTDQSGGGETRTGDGHGSGRGQDGVGGRSHPRGAEGDWQQEREEEGSEEGGHNPHTGTCQRGEGGIC